MDEWENIIQGLQLFGIINSEKSLNWQAVLGFIALLTFIITYKNKIGFHFPWKKRIQHPKKSETIEIAQWLTTNKEDIRIGLSLPKDKTIVNTTPIESLGKVVGLDVENNHFWIQGFVITDKEYEQGSSFIDIEGFWKINEINLGATKHRIFFKIFDESRRMIAESEEIVVYKTAIQ